MTVLESQREEKVLKIEEEKDMDAKMVSTSLETERTEVEENIYWPDDYDNTGCPTVPLVFSGVAGRETSHQSQHPHVQA